MKNPWRHVFEHSLWTMVALVTSAVFFALLAKLPEPWDWLVEPLAGPLILGMAMIWLLVRPHGDEAGADFPLVAFPIPVLPLALVALRRAIPTALRRFNSRRR